MRFVLDGTQTLISYTERAMFFDSDDEEAGFTEGTLPNDLVFTRNGDFLISNFATDLLERMTRDGKIQMLHDNTDGEPMGKVNFVLGESKSRLWRTISTRAANRMRSFTPDVDDGYVALVDCGSIRIVVDGFTFTNEVRLDTKEEFLYVLETTASAPSPRRRRRRACAARDIRSVQPRQGIPGMTPPSIPSAICGAR